MRGLLLAASAVLLAAGCSSSSSRPAAPTIGAARTYHLAGFKPLGSVPAGKRLVVTAVAALASAAAIASAVLWVAGLAVRERHLLAGGEAPALSPLRVVGA